MNTLSQSAPCQTITRVLTAALLFSMQTAIPGHAQKVTPASSDATSAASSAHNDTNHRSSPSLITRPRYTIHPSDVIDLGFPLSPEFNQTITVTPDGYISLRGVGDLSVTGKTLPQLRQLIRESYASILHDPMVNVDLKDFQKPYFTVGGEVGHPGKYDLRDDTTVLEALAIAGGTTVSSRVTQVLLFRRLPGGSMVEVRKLNMKKMVKHGNLSEDAHLEPGDLIYVPKSPLATIERFLPTSSLGMYATPLP